MATNTNEREEIKPVAPTEQTKWRDPSLVGKYMFDPKTGLAGLFRSPDNGETWVLTDTVYGHVYNQDEVDNIWDNGAGHKVADEIKSATADLPNVRKQADSAVKFAESAIAASKVNSDAIVAQSSAVVEAKSAMDSATAEIQQLKANAASDAAKIRADVARVQSEVDTTKAANSASVEALKSDIGSAKKDLADIHDSLDKAQSAIEQNQKLINDSVAKITSDVSATKQDLANVHDSLAKVQAAAEANQKAIDQSIAQINSDVDGTKQDLAGVRKDLTKAQADITANQKSINDNVAQINADITQDRKDIASVQQANADTAKQLDAYSKQAQEQGRTIKAVQDKQDGFSVTLADVQGNVAQVSDKVDGLSASLKDAQGNVAGVKVQADQLSATLTDHAKSITTLTASVKELSSTLEDAGGRLSKIEQTAKTNSSTLADVQGDLSQVKQDATTLTATLKDAQGNISMLQQKADSVSAQLATAQGDIATLQTGIAGVKATLASHDKSIHTLQLDSKSLKDSMTNAQGDISTLQKSATSLDSEMKDHAGRLSKVEQTAQEHTSTLSNIQGNLSQVKQTADGLTDTLKDAQGDITKVQATAKGLSEQITNAQGAITDLQTDVTGIKATITDHDKNIHTLQADAKSLTDDMTDAQGNISKLQKTAESVESSLEDASGRLSKVEQTATEHTSTLSDLQGNLSQVKQTADGLVTTLKDAQGSITQIQQKADGTLTQLKSAQGDIASLQTDVTDIKATLVSHEGDIHTLQADSKSLHDSMQDAQGDISTLKKTSTDVTSELKDHAGRISKTEQTASTLVNEFADQQGHLNRVEQTAQGTQQTVANQQGQINNIKTDVAGIHETITGQGNQIANINVTLNGLNTKYEGVSGDLNKLKSQAQWVTVTSAVDLNNVKTPCHEFLKGRVTNAPNETAWWYLTVESSDDGNRVTQTVIADQSNNRYTRRWANVWSAWVKDATQTDFTALSNRITTNSTQITQNKQAIALKADQSSVDNLSGEVSQNKAQLKVQADQISSKVSSEDFKTLDNKVGGAIAQIQKNSTAIDQTNKEISLKADQTEVDEIKGTASQNSSRLDVMAGEIKSKVDETKVNNIVDSKGYVTTSTVQSLITQKAGQLSESITNLTNEFNTRDGVNLLEGTKTFAGSWRTYDNGNHWHTENWIDPFGNSSVKSDKMSRNGYYQSKWLDVGTYTFSLFYYLEANHPANEGLYIYCVPNGGDNLISASPISSQSLDITPNRWNYTHFTFKVTKAGYSALRIESTQPAVLHISSYKLQRGKVDKPVWTSAPSDNATVTQLQSITASIDGLQSNVTNFKNDTSSRITQLSNMIQSKVSTSDFNALKDKATWKSTDSIDLNTAVSQQKIFVTGGSNLPPGKYWWYVQVEPGYDSRIVQYAVSDRDNIHYSRQYDGSKWSAWSQGATESEITQLRDDINLRVKSGDLLSQINLTAHNTLIQSGKIYLDSSSTVFSGKAFIPSAAIVSLDADKINTGTLNTQMVSIGDDQTRLWARSNYLYLTGKDQGDAYNMRIGGDKIEFVTTEIPNNTPYMDGITPMYAIEYNGDTKAQLKVRSFNRLTGSNEFPVEMYDSVNISKDQLDFAANNQMKMQVIDGGVNIRPTLFLQNNTRNGTWAGFTRLDNSDTVEFDTGNNNGENFHVNSGARFMQYVYINGYARAQGWLTNSALSKKMNIRKLDLQTALDKIRQDDQYLYEYKRNVAQGIHDPQASFIIDDVHDVAHYSVPREFIDQTGKYREPNVELAYLIAAFQAIDKQVQAQQAEIKALKEQLNNEQ